jgi:hypothetical protein
MSELGLLGLIAALHVVALGGGAVLVSSLLRADHVGRNDAASDGPPGPGDAGPPRPPPPTRPPLRDAHQAPVRLRGPGRLADRLPARQRRAARVLPDRRDARRAPARRQRS